MALASSILLPCNPLPGTPLSTFAVKIAPPKLDAFPPRIVGSLIRPAKLPPLISESWDCVVPDRGLQGNSIEDASATQSGARDLNIFGSTFVWRGAEVFIKKDAVAKTTRFASFEYFASGVFSRVASIRLDTSTGESAITGTQNDFVAGVESHDSNWWRVWMYYREADGNTSEFISLYPARGAGTDLTVDDAAAQGEVIYSGFRAFEPAITPADSAVLTGNITVVPASSTITMSGTVQVQVAGISGDVRLRHVVNPATAIGFGNTRVTYVADEGEEPPTGQNLVTESVEDSNATNDAWRFGTVTTEAINDWYCVRAFVLKDAIGKATRFPSLRFYTSGTALKIASIQFDTNTGEFLVENDTEMDAVGNVESFDAAWWLVTLYAKVENANNNYVLQLHPAYGAGTDLSVKDNTATGKITYAGYAGYTPQLPNAQSADISGSIVTAGVIALSGTVQAQPILLHAAIKRGNVLTFESDFTNAIWAPGFDNLTSVTPNSDTAPDGTLTADTLTDSDSNSPDRARQTMVSWSPVLPIFTSLYVKKDAVAKETRFAALRIEFAKDSSSSGLLVAHNIVFDTQDGSYELQSTAGEEDYNLGGGVVSVDDDWWYVYLIAVNSDGASTEAEIAVHPAMGNYTTFWDQNNTINGSIVAWNAHAEFIQETGVDRLIGVIQAQEGLGIGVIERAITLDGTIQAEAPLLQADNLVQTQDSAITGNVTVSGAITMSGTIQSQSSIITGDIERAVVLSGTVQSEAPGISGDIERIVTSSGTIQAAAADISGNIVTAGVIVLSGAVQAQSPIITGDVERVITTSGVVQAQNSDITGTISRLIESSGVVTSAAADISGSIVTAGVIALSGSLQAQASGISGVMERIITASGTIQAQDSTLTGDIERVITSSGVIASANAVVVGDIERIITMLGTLPSGSSSITGAVERVITSSGIVSAQSSDVSGSIVTAGNIVMSGTISSADSQITGDVSNFGNTFISGIADAQNATVTATIKRQLDYTGTVNAENAGVIGEVERVITLSGNVSSDAAAITSGIIDAFKTMSGTIQAQNAQVVGDVERIVTMSGLIGAEAANVVGDVERIITMSGIVQTDNSTLTGVFVIGEVPQEIYNVTLHINRDIMFTTNIQQSENQSLHVVPTAEISLNLIDESTFEVN